MIHYAKSTSTFLLALAFLFPLTRGRTSDDTTPSKNGNTTAFREIRLHDIGYQAIEEYHYSGTGVPRNLDILNDDYKKRLAFIDDKLLAVYFSHQPVNGNGGADSRNMEALFIDPNSGTLISRKAWTTRKRKWVNDRWDTQARILPVNNGFVVHAGSALVLYTSDQREMAKVALDDKFSWAAAVAVFGHTIHLQRIADSTQAEGRWITSDTLKQLETQKEVPGVTSASDHAVAAKLAHCVRLQTLGESPRDLCCYDPCRLGLPEFLSNSEILSAYPNGFIVLSDHGEKLWGREIAPSGNRVVANHARSLDGSHFAIALTSDRNIIFDQVQIAKGQPAILVYDRFSRTRVFVLQLGAVAGPFDVSFSPDGNILAVLVGDSLRLYKTSSS